MRFISNRKIRAFAALFVSGSILFSAVPARADKITDLENKSLNLERELASVDMELLSLSGKIMETEAQIAITDSEMQRTEDMLEQSVLEEEKQYEAMKNRIKYMYESGTSSLLEMLFSAENLSDFVNKADFVQSVSEYDRKMLTELQDIKEEISVQRTSISEQKESLTSLKDDLKRKESNLASRANSLSVNLDEYQAMINSLRADESTRHELDNIINQNNNSGNNDSADKPAPDKEDKPSPDTDSKPAPESNASDVELFAALLQCEAPSDYNSLLAVATVVMNRVESPRFPNNIHDVIYAPGQFEPTWTGRLDRVLKHGASSLSRQVAQDAINGKRLASVSDCYYFLYAPATSRQGVVIGNNVFFRSW